MRKRVVVLGRLRVESDVAGLNLMMTTVPSDSGSFRGVEQLVRWHELPELLRDLVATAREELGSRLRDLEERLARIERSLERGYSYTLTAERDELEDRARKYRAIYELLTRVQEAMGTPDTGESPA